MPDPSGLSGSRARLPGIEQAVDLDVRSMADAMPQLVWIARADGYIEYYNRSCFDYTGMTFDELRGWGWQLVLHPDEVQEKLNRWAESLRTGHGFEIEYRLRKFDGTYVWHLGRAMPLRDGNGVIAKWVGAPYFPAADSAFFRTPTPVVLL